MSKLLEELKASEARLEQEQSTSSALTDALRTLQHAHDEALSLPAALEDTFQGRLSALMATHEEQRRIWMEDRRQTIANAEHVTTHARRTSRSHERRAKLTASRLADSCTSLREELTRLRHAVQSELRLAQTHASVQLNEVATKASALLSAASTRATSYETQLAEARAGAERAAERANKADAAAAAAATAASTGGLLEMRALPDRHPDPNPGPHPSPHPPADPGGLLEPRAVEQRVAIAVATAEAQLAASVATAEAEKAELAYEREVERKASEARIEALQMSLRAADEKATRAQAVAEAAMQQAEVASQEKSEAKAEASRLLTLTRAEALTLSQGASPKPVRSPPPSRGRTTEEVLPGEGGGSGGARAAARAAGGVRKCLNDRLATCAGKELFTARSEPSQPGRAELFTTRAAQSPSHDTSEETMAAGGAPSDTYSSVRGGGDRSASSGSPAVERAEGEGRGGSGQGQGAGARSTPGTIRVSALRAGLERRMGS